ncbi:MAG: hypothetical protein EXR77_16400 [Myxococcales bacterium]|nr:hypothetical protein [Myxococcales bacterium]
MFFFIWREKHLDLLAIWTHLVKTGQRHNVGIGAARPITIVGAVQIKIVVVAPPVLTATLDAIHHCHWIRRRLDFIAVNGGPQSAQNFVAIEAIAPVVAGSLGRIMATTRRFGGG